MRNAATISRDGQVGIPIRRTIFLHICSALCGMFLSGASAFDSLHPFGVAFTAGIRREYAPSAAVGVIIGSFFSLPNANGIKYIGAAVIATAIKWVLTGLYADKNEDIISLIAALASSAACSVMVIATSEPSLDYAVKNAGEVLLAAGCAYFVSAALPLLNSGRALSRLTVDELCSAVIFAAIMLMALSPLEIFDFSPARIVACVLILCAARYGRETAGTICGAVFGFAMSITSQNMFYIVGAYAMGGLLGGIFSRAGTVIGSLSFLSGIVMMSVGFYTDGHIAAVLCEGVLAVAIFRLLPKSVHNTLGDLFAPAPQYARVDGLRRNMVMRMRFASNALTDVSETVEEVSGRLMKKNMPSLSDVFNEVENESCANCGLRIHCYETSRDGTLDAFLNMTKQMHKKGKLRPDEYPEKWQSRCLSPDRVADSLYKHFSVYESKNAAEMRIAEIRSVVSDQMCGLSDMLYDMSQELNESERYDTETAEHIDSAMRKIGIQATDVSCKLDKHRRMTVEICALQLYDKSVSKLEILNRVNAVSGRKFDVPCITNGGSRLLITLTEKANFKVDIGVAQYSCKDEKLCGDSYSYFDDGKGKTVMILSDGMGCGGRAAVDSAMVSGLISRLVKAGFGFECSLKLVNSAMLFKSTDESLATVDITAIDLFSGQADFYKAGTPETVVLKGKKIGRAACKSYPAGILRDVEFDKTSTLLDNRNIVLMMSDGVTDSQGEWLEEALKSHNRSSAQQLAEHIATLSRRRRDDGHEDDITVMVGIMEKAI